MYRFVGTECAVGDRLFVRFGQAVSFAEAEARENIRGGLAILTEEQFAEFGFTEAELKAYPTVGAQLSAPPNFLERVNAARDLFRQIRLEVLNG